MLSLRKHLTTTAAVAALAAGVASYGSSALAAPELTMTLTEAGVAVTCAAGFTAVGTDSCTATTAGGGLNYDGAFGNFLINTVGGYSDPYPTFSQPQLWLSPVDRTSVSGSTMTVDLVVSDYTMPAGAFNLLSVITGTSDPGFTTGSTSYFDDTDSGMAGVGTALCTSSGPLNAGNSCLSTVDNDLGSFTESWVYTVTVGSLSVASGTSQNDTLDAAIPEPASLALLGSGLVAFGAWRRRRKA